MNQSPARKCPCAHLLCVAVVALFSSANSSAQQQPAYEISAGFSSLTNSYNGLPSARQPLFGWNSSVAFPAWHNLRFKLDVSGYNGTNLDASQNSLFILAGGQYEHSIGRERIFGEALFGDGRINRTWGPNGQRGNTATFAIVLGGGVDTPISPHLALRLEGGLQQTNLAVLSPPPASEPYEIAGLPNYFGRFSTGLVYTSLRNTQRATSGESSSTRPPSELAFQSLNSFGHFHIFGNTWWSYLNVAGVEYDRPSWGRFIGARRDYAAEILPVVLLRQPKDPTIWGLRTNSQHVTVPGVGLSPIGMRLLWNDGGRVKPYFNVMGGLFGFTQKALSPTASYLNFTMQESLGLQLSLGNAWDLRAAVGDYHFSNAFIVPSNPGLDSMMYTIGLSRRLHGGLHTLRP